MWGRRMSTPEQGSKAPRRVTAIFSGQKVPFDLIPSDMDIESVEKALAKYLVAAWLEQSKRAPGFVTRYSENSPPRCATTSTGLTKTTYEGGPHG
jgi:hypothetical protein